MKTAAPRLTLTLAKAAPVAVILRQGPSRRVRMIRWDMKTDHFELGQWLHARVANFDLSADGRYALSFVQGYRVRDEIATWVAISRPPWFSALAVWSIGDSWGGQALFLGPRSLYIGRGIEPVRLAKGTLPKGWSWTSQAPTKEAFENTLTWKRATPNQARFEKPVGGDHWVLGAEGESWKYRYTLVARDGESIELAGAAHADVDARGRVVEARSDGCIYVWKQARDHWSSEVLLDTNDMRSDPQPPPAEALRWWR